MFLDQEFYGNGPATRFLRSSSAPSFNAGEGKKTVA